MSLHCTVRHADFLSFVSPAGAKVIWDLPRKVIEALYTLLLLQNRIPAVSGIQFINPVRVVRHDGTAMVSESTMTIIHSSYTGAGQNWTHRTRESFERNGIIWEMFSWVAKFWAAATELLLMRTTNVITNSHTFDSGKKRQEQECD